MTNRLNGLEAIRGLAAVMVAVLHAALIAKATGGAFILVEKAYLAVDLFFLLSGYVLTRTYEHRMPSAPTFLIARFRRLWLPVATGVMLCTGLYLALGNSVADLLPFVLASLAILPIYGFAINLNLPAWSIFFELVANFAHALLFRRVPTLALLAMVAVCAAWLALTTGDRGLNVGFAEWFWGGFPRVLMSYMLGIVLWRTWGDRPVGSERLGWLAVWAYVPLVAAVPFLLPPVGEIAFVLVTGPLILLAALGIGDSPMARLLGAYSFPLYALHYPLQLIATAIGLGWQGSLLMSLAGAASIALLVDGRWRKALGEVIVPGAKPSVA
ncbi:MAG: acyltransferase [Erythrobacter sp.]